jgi:hypothetical protein
MSCRQARHPLSLLSFMGPMIQSILKKSLLFLLLTVFLVPTLSLPCQAKMFSMPQSHACCHSKTESSGLQFKMPPCCDSCQWAHQRPMLVPSSPTVSQELFPLSVALATPTSTLIFKSAEHRSISVSSHSPPLYLSFQNLLC